MARVTRRQAVVRYRADERPSARALDDVVVEEPLEIRIGGVPFQVTMRTPGADVDLVHGLLRAEGVIDSVEDIRIVRYCDGVGPDGLNTYNVLDVELADGVQAPDPGLSRNVLTSSACGVCGSVTIDSVMDRAAAPLTVSSVAADLVARSPDLLAEVQSVHRRTGGAHAVGLVSFDGTLLAGREDIGRHNAADKVIGWAVREGRLPLSRTIMVVSARASYELTQKAVLAGVEVLVAVSAPSSLAVELADRAGLTLAAFVRGGSMNVYTHPERLEPPG